MKVKVVFNDWQEVTPEGFKSIYNTQKGVELSLGSLHSGSMWTGEINFDADTEQELKNKGKSIIALFQVEV